MNNIIIYVGMDVHTTNYTLSCYNVEKNICFATTKVAPDYKNILSYLKRIKENIGCDCKFVCGYEAGCLGYVLYKQLKANDIECIIIAPTSMPQKTKEIKTDKRDAEKIARCLAWGDYSPVYVPTDEDNSVKEYIRMRNAAKAELKRTKQQILAFCTREGVIYKNTTYWTKTHVEWLRKHTFTNPILNEILQEYLLSYSQILEKVERFDKRIEEFSNEKRYSDKVKRLCCFMGISYHTALALIVETGDFKRFKSARNYAAYLGLVPGESSSGNTVNRLSITKAGNSHLRKLLVESAQAVTKYNMCTKSKHIKQKQEGNTPEIIAYADKANARMKRKYIKMTSLNNIHGSIAKTAVARELSCFIWGMMTDNIY